MVLFLITMLKCVENANNMSFLYMVFHVMITMNLHVLNVMYVDVIRYKNKFKIVK